MLTYEEIKELCTNYKVENGIIYNKKNNQQVIDEDTILKVKSSILLYKEAYSSYEEDIRLFGKTNKSQDEYLLKTMEKFSVNGENNTYGVNKLINAILTSNGHYEEMMSGNDLLNSKFSILVAPKQEYGLAYLRLKFREKGLDIDNLAISQDLSELKHNGVSKVIIKFKIKEYIKEQKQSTDDNSISLYSHPKAKELNELEHQKQIARQNNDEVGYNYAKRNIERIIKENPVTITPQQWDNMDINSKISFIKVKINESKILHDQDSFNYWNANLKILESKQKENNVHEYHTMQEKHLKMKPSKNDIIQNDSSILIDKLKSKISDVSNEFKQMLLDGYIDYNELYALINRFNELSENVTALKETTTNEEDIKLLVTIDMEITKEKQKMINIQKEMQESVKGHDR